MIRMDLLGKELEVYKKQGKELLPQKYQSDKVFNLFRKYKHFGMIEYSYCCYGEERNCWMEIVEEGVWFLTLKQVRRNIIDTLKSLKDILRGRKKHGNRYYVYQDKHCCYIYIYARDLKNVQADYLVWFSSESQS